MKQAQMLHVEIEQGQCWGQHVSEDTGLGACQLCVELCPEVFEKPIANWCAFARPDVDATPHLEKVYEAIGNCPVEAIQVYQDSEDKTG
ncbi:MAG: ferredoxin [Dehalococcoidia bacterium]